ncbi:MAG: NADH-ubiquinone oxidoreductase chain M, partial [uncultured Rubrobacteraceae bacterium]
DHHHNHLHPAARRHSYAAPPGGGEASTLRGPRVSGGAAPAHALYLLRVRQRPRGGVAHPGLYLAALAQHGLPGGPRRPGLRDVLPDGPAHAHSRGRLLRHQGKPQAVLRDPVYSGGRYARGLRRRRSDPVLHLLRDHAHPDVSARRHLGRREPPSGRHQVLRLHVLGLHGDARGLSRLRHPRRHLRDGVSDGGRRPRADGPDRHSGTHPLRPLGQGAGGAAARMAARRVRLQPDFDERGALGHPAEARHLRADQGGHTPPSGGRPALPAVPGGLRGDQHNLRRFRRLPAARPEGARRLLVHRYSGLYPARRGLGQRGGPERGGAAAGHARALLGSSVRAGRRDRDEDGDAQDPGARRPRREDAVGRRPSGARRHGRDGPAGARGVRLRVYEHHGRLRRLSRAGHPRGARHRALGDVFALHAGQGRLRPDPEARLRGGGGRGAHGDGGGGAARRAARPLRRLPGAAHQRAAARGRGGLERDRGKL